MPYIYKDVERIVREAQGIECSKCKRIVYADGDLEFQETMHYRTVGGYDSVWGDGADIEVDLYQHCAYDLFKDFATVHESNY